VAGELEAGGTGKETVIRDMAAGTTTTIRSREGSLAESATVTPFGVGPSVGGGYEGLTESTRAVVRDTATGRIVKVILTSTGSGQNTLAGNLAGPHEDPAPGKHRAPALDPTGTFVNEDSRARVTVTTTTLDVTDENRAAVEQWIRDGQPDGDGAVGRPDLHYPDRAVPGDPFQNALHDKAKVTRVPYDDGTVTHGIDAKVTAGWTLGVEAGIERTTSEAGEATHLGTADRDGVRHPVPTPH
jgi:hypothetical protein